MQNIKFFFIISIIILSGCERHNERILQLLQSKDMPPYELLSTLDSIDNTQNLSTEDRYDYTFLKTIARYKLKKIQAIDTLLHKEVAYYDEKEDAEKSAFLLLCIGQAYRQAHLYEQSDLHYMEAAVKAEKLTDQMLMLYIYYERGSLYSMLNDKEGAVQLFESMMQLARKDSLLKKQLETTYPFLDASDALLYLGEYEKATEWYQKNIRPCYYACRFRNSFRNRLQDGLFPIQTKSFGSIPILYQTLFGIWMPTGNPAEKSFFAGKYIQQRTPDRQTKENFGQS